MIIKRDNYVLEAQRTATGISPKMYEGALIGEPGACLFGSREFFKDREQQRGVGFFRYLLRFRQDSTSYGLVYFG